jgi:hypothetical protein
MSTMIISCKLLVGKLKGIRPLGRPRHELDYNTKMDLTERGYGARNGFKQFRIDRGSG